MTTEVRVPTTACHNTAWDIQTRGEFPNKQNQRLGLSQSRVFFISPIFFTESYGIDTRATNIYTPNRLLAFWMDRA